MTRDQGALPAKMLAPVLAAPAALLAIAGSFLPLAVLTQDFPSFPFTTITISSWTQTIEPALSPAQSSRTGAHTAYFGIPLTLLALVLLAGTVLGARRASGGSAKLVLLAGSSGLAATVLAVGMQVWSVSSQAVTEDAYKLTYSTGIGLWLEVAATGLALAAATLAFQHSRAPDPNFPPPSPDREEEQYVRALPSEEPPPDYQPPVHPAPVLPPPPQQHQQPPLFPADT